MMDMLKVNKIMNYYCFCFVKKNKKFYEINTFFSFFFEYHTVTDFGFAKVVKDK